MDDSGRKSRLLIWTPAVIDASALQLVLAVLTGWLDRREREVLRYLVEEYRVLRRQLRGRRVQLRTTIGGGWPYGSAMSDRFPVPATISIPLIRLQ
jgi:hypothetical protein